MFESVLGNTRQIAEAVTDGLSGAVRTDLVEVSRAPAQIPGDVELGVAGGPTHAFGITRPGTRWDAARLATGPLVSGAVGRAVSWSAPGGWRGGGRAAGI